jgi:hypothetical protein
MFVGLDGRDAYLTTNGDGLRTGYSPESFVAYDTRVIALGDSFTSRRSFARGMQARLPCSTLASPAIRPSSRRSWSKASWEISPDDHHLLDATDIGDDHRYTNEVQAVGRDLRFTVGDARCHPTAVPYSNSLDRTLGVWSFSGPRFTSSRDSAVASPLQITIITSSRFGSVTPSERNRFFI